MPAASATLSEQQCSDLTASSAVAVFQTSTKDSSTITMDTLQQICKAVDIPVVAIGGITAANAKPTLQAGCCGVAVVSAIFGAQDAAAAAHEIRAVVDAELPGR